jgi:HEAT repeat protein
MQRVLLSALTCAALLTECFAHGGQYRGPEDVVPPDARGKPPATGPRPPSGGPKTPNSPVPGGPITPTPGPRHDPTTPGGGPRPPGSPKTGGEDPLAEDFTRWEYWWEFNKDPYIRLKEAVHNGPPTSGSDVPFLGTSMRLETRDLMQPSLAEKKALLPDLKRALEECNGDRDITSACLIAMAKIGEDHDSVRILDEFEKRLTSKDQEIREVAALAMGISQRKEAVDAFLVPIVEDNEKGRELVARSEVDDRTRSFACYGLGLIAYAVQDADVKTRCFTTLKKVLEDERIVNRNLKVAAIHGLRLIRPQPQDNKQKALLDDCVDVLWSYYGKDLGQGAQRIQAHVPAAVASLLGRGGDATGKLKDALAGELTGDKKRATTIYQSAALALGQLVQSKEENAGDEKYSLALRRYYANGRDLQARYFSLVALGLIGGGDNKAFLLEALGQGKKSLEKPWAAVALGVQAFRDQERFSGRRPDAALVEALRRELSANSNPSVLGALAIALGLSGATAAEGDLLEQLGRYRQADEVAGHLCLGLALMGSRSAITDIRNVVERSLRRPELMKHAAIALGKLGDKEITVLLQSSLTDKDQNLAKLSAVASALAFIGDRRSIAPLRTMLFDQSLTPLTRAFAAVALGGVADKEDLPWNSKIGVGLNYRAAVETLTNRSSGILDIL